MTKLSIIIPYRNVESYISKCLTTVLYQTIKDIEIICIDDSSEDGSREIVKQYAERDNRIMMMNTGGVVSGQSYARNLGLEVASGEYIGFVDSDDWVELDMFEKMYNKAKSDDADITMCGAMLYDDKKQEFYNDDYYSLKPLEKFGDKVFSPDDSKDEILNINVVLWNKIYKREFLKQINAKFQSGYIYEDMPFFFETYLKAKRINILWENLYYYRQNRRFSTMQNSNKKVYDRIDMSKLTYEILKQASFFEEKQDEIHRWIIDDIFHRYTLLEDKYYEEYYKKMREFFISLNLNEKQKEALKIGYCCDEFDMILERDYYGFWNFLIEKYKTSNKRIKAAEHKCNLDIKAIKDYLEQYKKEAAEDKEKAIEWWENFSKEERAKEVKRRLEEQYIYLESKKQSEMNGLYDEFNQKMVTQEYELKRWQAESLRQQKEKLTADYEWKLEAQRQHYMQALQQQKYYYENNFLPVKIVLKLCRKSLQIQNKIKKLIKKN